MDVEELPRPLQHVQLSQVLLPSAPLFLLLLLLLPQLTLFRPGGFLRRLSVHKGPLPTFFLRVNLCSQESRVHDKRRPVDTWVGRDQIRSEDPGLNVRCPGTWQGTVW